MIKKSLSSIAIRKVVEEAKVLKGAFFQKAYQIDYGTIVLRFAIRRNDLLDAPEDNSLVAGLLGDEEVEEKVEGISLGEGGGNYVRFDLYFRMGGYLFFSSKINSNMPKDPSPFAMKLRKELNNRILNDISQVGLDRLVVLTFNPFEGEEENKIYLELFGDGNMILVRGNRIEAPFTSRTWSSRTIKRGEEFLLPPSGIDPYDISREDLDLMARSSSDDLVRFLIRRINLPPIYSEEICHRSGIDKKATVSNLEEIDKEGIWSELKGLLSETRDTNGGYVHFQKGDPTMIEPCFLSSVFGVKDRERGLKSFSMERTKGEGDHFRHFGSINDAIETFMFEESKTMDPKESKKERGIDKLRRLLESQQKAKNEREDESERYRKMGDVLYTNYQKVEFVLKDFDKAAYKEDPSIFPDVISFTPDKRGKGFIKLGLDTEDGRIEVPLSIDRNINENAEILYEMAKRSKKKIGGIDKALEITKAKIEKAERDESDQIEREEANRKKLRKFWFENFRWCFSSEGALMIGGKDAKSNERAVKKYMRDNDVYAHADVSGAASVIVRVDPETEITDATRREACHFSVLHSRAWNAKVGSAGGYWVIPDQVSRTPQTGEFVAKGSFIIRGKKNIVDKIPLIGAIGTVYVEGVPKLMFGPEEAVKNISSGSYFVLRPGSGKKSEVAKIISRELGGELDQIMAELPSDGIDYRKIARGEA